MTVEYFLGLYMPSGAAKMRIPRWSTTELVGLAAGRAGLGGRLRPLQISSNV